MAEHGTYARSAKHYRDGELPCDPCRLAKNAAAVGADWKKQPRKESTDPAIRSRRRRRKAWRRKGITDLDRAEQLRREHNGLCALCGAATPGSALGWHLDHDHATGQPRAILCHGCNLGLGAFRDNPDLLLAAVAYLRLHSS